MGNFNFPLNLHLLLYVLVIISLIPASVSEIQNTRIADDSRPMILFERFGFSENGNVAVSVKDFSWKSTQHNAELEPSTMGFFLVRDASFPRIFNESEYADNFCVLWSRFVKIIFKFDNPSALNGSMLIDEPDEYSLIFGNCQSETQVTMDVHTEMYNIQDGNKNFLPVGQSPLPRLYFVFFLIYTIFLVVWVFICFKERSDIHKIHLIMGALLIFKALKMICASEDKMYVRKTGTPHGWDVAFYVFGFLKGIMLFTVIVLIGTGWSFLKPYLQEREKKVLMFVIPLQVMENIASVIIAETGPATKDWLTWNQIFLLLDVACCCAVFLPIIWSIRGLREASKTDGKAARNLEKLTLFKHFYIVVVGYLYFTRIVVPAVLAIISYRFEWVMTAADEGASLVFYLFIFHNFHPTRKNPYLVIHDEDEVAAAHMLEEDDSFEL